eukprot:m.306905 g.306905  ORF g.306905 m.306905 type:complete len:259 (+) comp41697_c0_seq1:127-903(+)
MMKKKLEEALGAIEQWKEQYARLEKDSSSRISYLKDAIRSQAEKSGRNCSNSNGSTSESDMERRLAIVVEENENHKMTANREAIRWEEKLTATAKAKESGDARFDAVAAKLDFVEKQHAKDERKWEETMRKQEERNDALQMDLNRIKAERDDLLAIREQVAIYQEDFLMERQHGERLCEEKRALETSLTSLRRQIKQLKTSAVLPHVDVGFLVTPEIIKEQRDAERWFTEQRSQQFSDLLPRSDGKHIDETLLDTEVD